MVDIENAAALTDLFGHWPDFHDAELRAVRLLSTPGLPAAVEVDIDVGEPSDAVDARGYRLARQWCATTLRFEDVVGASLTDFGPQNVLDELLIAGLSPAERAAVGSPSRARRYRVRCVPIAGFCELDLTCDRVAVVAARPFLPEPPGEVRRAAP